jgi:hypothetical protein
MGCGLFGGESFWEFMMWLFREKRYQTMARLKI